MTKRKWLRAAFIGGIALLVASFGFSRALRVRAVRRYLTAHLAVSFGRPVDVMWFDFSLFDGARIEAHFVSVSDDPHFGNEYFLRADTLTAGLRWRSVLAGRFEFGAVSLTRPSLNLARDAEGNWNIERWLPPASPTALSATTRPGFVGPMVPQRDARAARPTQIEVTGGRINFKQGDNKSPFALVDVSGSVEENGAGRWQLDLEARPMRAGVELQDIGTLRLRGSIAGTSARLQPAELNLTWRAASLADALRLAWQDDFGMRGELAVDLSARVSPSQSSPARAGDSGGAQWAISAGARLTGLHGWRLPGRDTDPAANLAVEMNWQLGEPRAEIRNLIVEMPASRLQGNGDLDWTHVLRPELHLETSKLGLADVLAWYRALNPGVAEDLRADGAIGLDLKVGGWPIQLQQGAIAGAGGTLTTKLLPAPLRIGPLKAAISRGEIDLAPTEISIGSAPADTGSDVSPAATVLRNSFIVRGSLVPQASDAFRWPPDGNISIEGATPRAQDWFALSAALAQYANSSWTATGGVAVKMRGVRRSDSPAPPWIGTMDFLGFTLSPAYVNQPLRFAKAHIDFAPRQRNVTLSAAEAFGAAWHGSMTRKYSEKLWTFDLSADRLDAAELDRWLGPRARPGFLARFAGANSAAAAAPPADSMVTQLAARGRLRAGSVAVPPMHMEQFDAEAEIIGRTIQIRKAQANFFGGKVSGGLDAQLLPDPSYEFQGRFDRVDLTQLGSAVSFLNARIEGNASAALTLSARGIGRQNLIGSLRGQGTVNGRNIELLGFNLSAAFPGENPDRASELFASIQGMYRIQNRGIDLANFTLENSGGRLEADGRIEFTHALNFRVRPSIFQAATSPASASPPSLLLTGTIEAPELVSPSGNSKPAARRNAR